MKNRSFVCKLVASPGSQASELKIGAPCPDTEPWSVRLDLCDDRPEPIRCGSGLASRPKSSLTTSCIIRPLWTLLTDQRKPPVMADRQSQKSKHLLSSDIVLNYTVIGTSLKNGPKVWAAHSPCDNARSPPCTEAWCPERGIPSLALSYMPNGRASLTDRAFWSKRER